MATSQNPEAIDIDLTTLTYAQLLNLRQAVAQEEARRWDQYAADPRSFTDTAAEMTTQWLEQLIGQNYWDVKWMELKPWQWEVHRIAEAELSRRQHVRTIAHTQPVTKDETELLF